MLTEADKHAIFMASAPKLPDFLENLDNDQAQELITYVFDLMDRANDRTGKFDIIRPLNSWPTVQVKTQQKTDPKADQLLGIKPDETIYFIPLEQVFIMKGQMTSGKPGVTLYSKAKDGLHVFFETSGAIMEMINGAVQGAQG